MEIHSDLLNIAQSVQPNAEVHLISSKNSDGILTLKGKIQNFAKIMQISKLHILYKKIKFFFCHSLCFHVLQKSF